MREKDDMKNDIIEYIWKPHSSYYTEGEAKTKSTRLMLFINKPTKVKKIDEKYWIMVGYNPKRKSINMRLNV